MPWPNVGPVLGHVSEQRQGGEVALDDLLDARTLHLDDHRLARVQSGDVGLADRGRGERLPVELLEDVLDVVTQLGLEHRSDLLDRLRLDSVLEPGQLGADLGREQIDACRRDLTELHVDAAGLLEQVSQPGSGADRRPLLATARGDERTEARLPDEADELAVAHAAPRSVRRMARIGRGATTSPARSPIASEPGRAKRSSATATAIVAGMLMATMWRMRPSEPKSQSDSCSASTAAIPQPKAPDEERRPPASPHAEQPQRERGRDDRDEYGQADPRPGPPGRTSARITASVRAALTIRPGRRHRPRRGAGRCWTATLSTSSRARLEREGPVRRQNRATVSLRRESEPVDDASAWRRGSTGCCSAGRQPLRFARSAARRPGRSAPASRARRRSPRDAPG